MTLKIKKIMVLILVVLAVGVYFFITDFQILKKIVGYNVPGTTSRPSPGPSGELGFLTLSGNLSISVFAKDLKGPRVIAFDPMGRMLVSEPKEGKVMVLEDKDKNGVADGQRVVLQGLRLPHGLDFYTDPKTKIVYLYVAETHQVSRFVYDSAKGEVPTPVGHNIANLPADGRHFSRTIVFGPNFRKEQIIGGKSDVNTQVPTKLYISVGSSCDVCVETETWKRAAILESDPGGNFTAEFAGGLRNSVFFAFHPETKEMWATDMGRDNLGDELPPDEVNIIRVAEEGNKFGARRYGWPFCYGNKVPDTTFKPGKIERTDIPTNCSQTEPPVIELPAHSAPLGLAFVPKDGGWPKEWRNDLLVAYHGSWNRSEPTGYKVVRFDVDEKGRSSGVTDFISGWLAPDNKTLGRPVDLKFGPRYVGGFGEASPDSALYISDDSAGMIYRVDPVK